MTISIAPLVRQLAWREIETRYRGSVLGVLWSFLIPLMMLCIFTFVFAVVLKARWGQSDASTTQFAIMIFAGLTTFGLFSEVAGRAPVLITSQPHLVKKVVFPLEILPVVALVGALFQAAIATVILLFFQGMFGSGFHIEGLLVPILVLPLCLFTLGIAWFLAALGVFVRDIGQIMPPLITALMFLSPIFYPLANLPEWIRPIAAESPMAFSIETVRNAVAFGALPDLTAWLAGLAWGAAAAMLGFAFFRKTRKGFADVL